MKTRKFERVSGERVTEADADKNDKRVRGTGNKNEIRWLRDCIVTSTNLFLPRVFPGQANP